MNVETMRFKDLMKSPDEEATELMFWKFLIEGIQIQRPELTPLQASFFAAKFWHRAMVFNGDTTIEEAMEFSKLGGQSTEFFGTLKSFYMSCGMKKSFAKGGPFDEVFQEVNDFQPDMDVQQ